MTQWLGKKHLLSPHSSCPCLARLSCGRTWLSKYPCNRLTFVRNIEEPGNELSLRTTILVESMFDCDDVYWTPFMSFLIFGALRASSALLGRIAYEGLRAYTKLEP